MPSREKRMGGGNGKARLLERRVRLAARFKGKNGKDLLEKIKRQVEEFGIDYVLSNVSPEARLLYLRYRAVSREIYRTKAFSRFDIRGDLYISKIDVRHRVEDAVLRHFTKRFPRKTIILLSRKAWIGKDGEMAALPVGALRIERRIGEKKDELWDTYYDSCYIESRRNKRLTLQRVPKKYQKGMREYEKMKRGIQDEKLLHWL